MMRRHIQIILLFILVLFIATGCSKNTIRESTTDRLSFETTTKETTTEEASSSKTTSEPTTDAIETTNAVINEEIYIVDNLPEVNVIENSLGNFTISITTCDVEVIENVELNPSWSSYNIRRVDTKVISIELFSTATDNLPFCAKTCVFSSSGDRIDLLDIISDMDTLNEYFSSKGYNLEAIDLSTINWYFDITGLVITIEDRIDGEEKIFIPYEDFYGMINTNYIPDNGPMYGTYYLMDSTLKYNGHELVNSVPGTAWMTIDGENYPLIETDDHLFVPWGGLYLVDNDNRHYLCLYDYEVYPDDNGNSVVEYKCTVLLEITNGTLEIVATTDEGPFSFENIYDIPEDILELINFSEW